MAVVKAADLPPTLLYAFSDALEAWGDLEWELFQLWQMLNGSSDHEEAWKTFSDWHSAKQRDNTKALVEKFRDATDYAPRIPEVFERLDELAGTRNRIVHGYWHPIHLVVGGKEAGKEYIRQYDSRGFECRPVDTDDEQRMLGQSRFYEPQLKDAEARFREAARDMMRAKGVMVGSLEKWLVAIGRR